MHRQESTGETRRNPTVPEAPTKLKGVWYSSDAYFCRPIMELALGTRLPDQCTFLAGTIDGEEWCMYAICYFSGYDAELYVVNTGHGTPMRTVTRKVAEYCFNVCGCRRLTARVDVTNTLSLRFCLAFGFVREGTLRKASPEGHDIAVLGLLPEEFRYQLRSA